jgi:hypothetical protein
MTPKLIFAVIIIGCGTATPISTYLETTSSPYPIYSNPSIELYKLFDFKPNLAQAPKGEEREYEKGLGSTLARLWGALKSGPGKNIGHVGQTGPISQNGGEIVLEAGECGLAV